jgi:hypothetical protein
MKTLVVPYNSTLYVSSSQANIACDVQASVHYMQYEYLAVDGEESYKEVVGYSEPDGLETNKNNMLSFSTNTALKRVVKEVYLHSLAQTGTTVNYDLLLRTYLDDAYLTLPPGNEDASKRDYPSHYIETKLHSFNLSSGKIWRLSEVSLFSYPSPIVLSKDTLLDELYITVEPAGSYTLLPSDKVHVTISHGETRDGNNYVVNERLEQKIISGTVTTPELVYKVPALSGRSPWASVIRQICVYNNSSRNLNIKIGLGKIISGSPYIISPFFSGTLEIGKAWWSDSNVYQQLPVNDPLNPNNPTPFTAVQPLDFDGTTNTLSIVDGQTGQGAVKQTLVWDPATNSWGIDSYNSNFTTAYPLEYDSNTLQLSIGQKGALNGQALVWNNTAQRWQPGNVVGGSGGSGGRVIDGDTY